MKKTPVKRLALFLLLSTPFVAPAAAMDHDMKAGGMVGMEMAEKGGPAKMVMLRGEIRAGVSISGHLIDIRQAMAENGMPQTHHLMVSFTGPDGKPISEGRCAVKVIAPDGSSSKALKMMAMGSGFGSDVTLAEKGDYRFEVGTKLADGVKRVFTIPYRYR